MDLNNMEKSWDLSANTNSRMKAVRFFENGKVSEEVIYDHIFGMINKHLNFTKEHIALEVGAGSCLLLERIAKNTNEIYGTDISEKQLSLSPQIHNAFLEKMPSDKLKFKNELFDRAVCYSVSQYFPDNDYAKRVFSELFRVVKKGGSFYVGDIFNLNLKKNFYDEQYNFITRTRMNASVAKIERVIRKKSPADFEYLFLRPEDVVSFFYKLGATKVSALLITEELKPEVHRRYRFDIVVTK